MSNTQSRSIYVESDGTLSIKEVTETYKPQGSQCLIKVQYSGINTCDLNFFHIGLHSFITGFELAGTVVETGPDSPFKVGEQVCGGSPVGHPQSSSFGTHQDLAIGEARMLFLVPSGLDMKVASVNTLCSQTAIDALFNALGFGFAAANISGTDPTGRPILIWGGATSVGIVAIQIAKIAGFSPIFTTASPKNHATLEKLGATKCFDYSSPSVINDIRAASKALNVTLATVFETAAKGAMLKGDAALQSSPTLARQAASPGVPAEELKLVCSQPVAHDPAYQFCTSYRPEGSVNALGLPQDPEAPERTRKIMQYFLETSERVLELPKISVVKGAEAGLRAVEQVGLGNVSMEKITIEHPM